MIINNFLEVEPKEEKNFLGGDRSVTLARVFENTPLTMDYIILESGSSIGLHLTKTDKMYIVLSGEGIIECDGDRSEVCAGDTVIVPNGSQSGVFNTSVFDLRIISVSPCIK